MLRIAIDPSFPPFESVDETGMIVGYDADLGRALAATLGVDAHFVTTGYDALYDALTVGRADVIISALYPDPSRSAGFAFSQPYFSAGEVMLVKHGSAISETQDLAGRTVACVFGTSGHMALLELEERLEPVPSLITVDSHGELLVLVDREAADAAVVDRVTALVAAGRDATFQILPEALTDEPYVLATRREDSALMRALEDALAGLAANGTLDQLTRTWMMEPPSR